MVVEQTDETVKKKELISMYEERLNRLQTAISNLEAQAKNKDLTEESSWRVEAQKLRIKLSQKEKELNNREQVIIMREDTIELREVGYSHRLKGLQARELEFISLEEQRAQLDEERHKFRTYKLGVEKDLEKAKEAAAEYTEQSKLLDECRADLDAKKRALEIEKDYVDVVQGILNKEKTDFELYKHNEISKITGDQ